MMTIKEREEILQAIADLSQMINVRFDRIDKRFDEINRKFDRIDRRFEKILEQKANR